ncbi:hypothetical protein K9L97_05205 [Candidatus Woesearchaeota archaeon]|nr:hypothetical protein [Candidatus Woesearchaeota archaeon]
MKIIKDTRHGLARPINEIKKVFGIPIEIEEKNLDEIFQKTTKFEGYQDSALNLKEIIDEEKNTMIITDKDIFIDEEDYNQSWILGYQLDNLTVVSTARIKRYDNKPSKKLTVPYNKFLKRLNSIVIHEIGHDVVTGNHLKEAFWITHDGYKMELGPHCTDNKCVMYEIVDITIPPKEEGFMLLGKEKKYDTGMDEKLKKQYPEYFCKKCSESIKIGKEFY